MQAWCSQLTIRDMAQPVVHSLLKFEPWDGVAKIEALISLAPSDLQEQILF